MPIKEKNSLDNMLLYKQKSDFRKRKFMHCILGSIGSLLFIGPFGLAAIGILLLPNNTIDKVFKLKKGTYLKIITLLLGLSLKNVIM